MTTVAAFHTEDELKALSIVRADPGEHEREALGYLLAHRLAIPVDQNPEKAMDKAIRLVTDNERFRENRQRLYEWQEKVIEEKVPPNVAIAEMDQMIEAYNRSVEKAVKNVFYKFAFTIGGVGLTLAAAGLFNPLATASAVLALVKFATFDKKPLIEPGLNAPAAMFHDVESSFKRFRPA